MKKSKPYQDNKILSEKENLKPVQEYQMNNVKSRKSLKVQLKKEIKLVKDESLRILAEFEEVD
ncbi:MAG: hypothetical protein MUE99_04320 [Chitinophagaceae bacterium]|nr:hypothetical protein [Chitinophagaceae bacterium]